MQSTSDLYKKLLDQEARKEVRVEIGGVVYGEDQIVSLTTSGSLFSKDTLCIGSAAAKEIHLELLQPGPIPKMAEIIPSYRLVAGDEASEWIPKGTFYIATRKPDGETGTLTIHGFDAMLKGEWLWEPDQELSFPMTCRAAASEIARLMGVELDNPEDIDGTRQIVDYPANEYTQRNVLQFIAAAHAANFVMTDCGKLRMIGINAVLPEAGYLVNEDGMAIVFGGVRIAVSSASSESQPAGSGSEVYVGNKCAAISVPPALDPISKIVVKVDEENCFEAGDDSGLTLEATCPYGTQQMADDLLERVGGFVYQPVAAEDALIDPSAELGDTIVVGDTRTILVQQDTIFDALLAGRICAPGEDEVENEYPYQTQEIRFNRKIAQTRALIEKTADEIRLSVSEVSDDLSTLEGSVSELSVKLNSITLSVSNGAYSSTIRLLANGIEIASQDISMSGMITVWDLSQSGATTINGDNITTGTIEGRTFRSILDASGNVGGEIEMCYLNSTTVAGGIRLDDQGAGTSDDRQYRMFVYTEEVEGIAFSLKLKSACGMSLEAVDNIYMSAGTVFRLIAPEIRLTGTVYINGVEYVPPTTEEETT